jgi:hypothetical protein
VTRNDATNAFSRIEDASRLSSVVTAADGELYRASNALTCVLKIVTLEIIRRFSSIFFAWSSVACVYLAIEEEISASESEVSTALPFRFLFEFFVSFWPAGLACMTSTEF